MSESPEQIGRYHIESLLGEGNMGCVYKGHDPNLKRSVAIKTLNSRLKKSNAKESQSFKDRFFREAHANSQLNHPNIVSIYDSGIEDDAPFLVMEYIEGGNLDEVLDHNPDLTYEERIALMEQMATGLDFAHEKGVIHRDIKPGNVLVTADMQVKIVDFGLARLKDSRMTTTGVFLGTPSYASPEQIVNGEVASVSDIFAFGIVVYETLFSKRPFPGENINSILFHIVHSDPDLDFKQVKNEAAPREVRKVFKKIFQKDPNKRYQNAQTFIQDLKAAFGMDPAQQSLALKDTQRVPLKLGTEATPPENGHEETVVVDSARARSMGTSLKRRRNRSEWLPFAIAGGLFILSVFLLLALRSDPQPADPVEPDATQQGPSPALSQAFPEGGDPTTSKPQASGTQLSAEEQAAQEEAEQAEARRLAAQEARAQEIEALRKSFNGLIDKEKVLDAELTMLKLQAMDVDISSQKRMLELLKTKRRQREDSRQLSKENLREAFTEAREARDLSSMRQALSRFEKNFPKDAVVIDTWREILQTEEKLQNQVVNQARERLSEAILNKEPLLAEEQYNILVALGQANEADQSAVEQLKSDVWYNSIGIKFMRIPAGQFLRGKRNPQAPEDAQNLQPIVISEDFFMSTTEITQGQWRLIIGSNPSRVRKDDHPVTNVSWYETRQFVEELQNLESGESYRLPTEAEWEYAARAGTETPFFYGEVLTPENANYEASGFETTKPVGSYPPNAFGLYDMHGNVSEWVADAMADYPPISETPLIDPHRVPDGPRDRLRVVRGGSYDHSASACASSYRMSRNYRAGDKEIGFRLVREKRQAKLAEPTGALEADPAEDGSEEQASEN